MYRDKRRFRTSTLVSNYKKKLRPFGETHATNIDYRKHMVIENMKARYK